MKTSWSHRDQTFILQRAGCSLNTHNRSTGYQNLRIHATSVKSHWEMRLENAQRTAPSRHARTGDALSGTHFAAFIVEARRATKDAWTPHERRCALEALRSLIFSQKCNKQRTRLYYTCQERIEHVHVQQNLTECRANTGTITQIFRYSQKNCGKLAQKFMRQLQLAKVHLP